MLRNFGLQKAGANTSGCRILGDNFVSVSLVYESHLGGTSPNG